MAETTLQTIEKLYFEGMSSSKIARHLEINAVYVHKIIRQISRQRIETSSVAVDRSLACLGRVAYGKADDRGPDNTKLGDFLRAITSAG